MSIKMCKTEWYIIGALLGFLIAGAVFVISFLVAENKERRQHYKITLAMDRDGRLRRYRSKHVEIGKEPITVVPADNEPICDVYVRLSDGEATIVDRHYVLLD